MIAAAKVTSKGQVTIPDPSRLDYDYVLLSRWEKVARSDG